MTARPRSLRKTSVAWDNPENRIHTRAVAELRWAGVTEFFHTPNEGMFPVQYRAKLARLGVSKGVPDLIVVRPVIDPQGGEARGAAIEIKAPKGRVSVDQKRWLGQWAIVGFAAVTTFGHRGTALMFSELGLISQARADLWIGEAQRTDPVAL